VTVSTSRTTGFSKYYVAALEGTDNVTYAAISSGAIGTAVDIGTKINANADITDLKLADGGSTTMMMVGSSDNVSIYTVGASGLTLWNDNLTTLWGADNITDIKSTAFAVSPNGDRAVLVGWYDNMTSTPLVAAFSPTAVDITNSSDNLSYNAGDSTAALPGGIIRPVIMADTGTRFTPDVAAAWCNDGSSGGALWLAISADNVSGFTLSKWTDNATVGADYVYPYSLFQVSGNQADNVSTDNITSLDMACDPDDSMPVLTVGYDSTNGDYALAKLDNTTSSKVSGYSGVWEILVTGTAAAATAGDPVTVAVSSDGSAFAVGYSATSGDNATIQIFYDE
jgi:hypothetical protein